MTFSPRRLAAALALLAAAACTPATATSTASASTTAAGSTTSAAGSTSGGSTSSAASTAASSGGSAGGSTASAASSTGSSSAASSSTASSSGTTSGAGSTASSSSAASGSTGSTGASSTGGSTGGADAGPSYVLTVDAPAAGATLSGVVVVSGTAPGFLNVEVWDASHQSPPLARATPGADGSFSATIDTTALPDGPDTWTVQAWDSPAGQTFSHSDSRALGVTVANGADAGSGLTPLGGPPGYTTLVLADAFGSARADATVTDASQLNPATPYGEQGQGWDLWMQGWAESAGVSANVAMLPDHLELYPTNGPPGFLVSHFEALPTATVSYYFEVRLAAGRGAYANGGGTTWPAIWLFSGNEPGADNQASEIDVMETYTDLAFGSSPDADGLYTQYFQSTSHPVGEGFTTLTPGVDVTTSYNVYGCELTLQAGVVQWAIYFNGVQTAASQQGLVWASTPPALIIGWNPGSSPVSPAVMKLDWVRVWRK